MKLQHLGMYSLLAISTFALSACGNKELSFEQALAEVNKDADLVTQLVLGATQPTQQTIQVETTISDGSGTTIGLAIDSQSQQDKSAGISKVDAKFKGEIEAE